MKTSQKHPKNNGTPSSLRRSKTVAGKAPWWLPLLGRIAAAEISPRALSSHPPVASCFKIFQSNSLYRYETWIKLVNVWYLNCFLNFCCCFFKIQVFVGFFWWHFVSGVAWCVACLAFWVVWDWMNSFMIDWFERAACLQPNCWFLVFTKVWMQCALCFKGRTPMQNTT